MKDLRGTILGPTPVLMRPFVSEIDSKFKNWPAPIGCFETPTKRLSNFQIKYSKTVQNTSVTILDHQKSFIAKKKVILFGECENSYFQKTWDCTEISKSMIFGISSLWRFYQKCVRVAIWRSSITQTKKLYWSFREGFKMFIKNLVGAFTDMISKSPKLVLLCLYLFW